jgi:hypothetical protein
MKPLVTFRPLHEFNPKRQRAICKCPKLCTYAVLIIQDEFTYQVCEKGTTEFAHELLRVVGAELSVPTPPKPRKWTPMEISRLKDYVLSFGDAVPQGAYSMIAKQMNKTRQQVKDKVQYLRSKNELPRVKK